MDCFGIVLWLVSRSLYGSFRGYYVGCFVSILYATFWPRGLRVLFLDYVMTCLVVVAR